MCRNVVRIGGGIALGLLALGAPGGANAETPFCSSQLKLVNEYLGPLVKPPSAPTGMAGQAIGAVVVTLKLGEKPCFFRAGEIIQGSGRKPDENTIFELASVTKVFTTAILALRAKEHFDVTAPVLPLLPPEYELQPEESGVTFQQLATFTGGFHWSDAPGFDWKVPYSQHDFVRHVNKLVPKHPIKGETDLPTYDHYSNGSIGFLGHILMHADSGKGHHYTLDATGFSSWIDDNLTGPLNMSATMVEPTCCDRAQGYQETKTGTYTALDEFPWVPWGAAGALRSNAADMLKFLLANVCAYQPGDPACTGLPSDILDALPLAHAPNSYTPSGTLKDPTIYTGGRSGTGAEQGWAWRYAPPPNPNPDNLATVISKDGGHPGFSTYIGFMPDKGYGLVILMNTGNVAAKTAGLDIIRRSN